MRQLAPGVWAREISSPFDLSRYRVHDAGASIRSDPLRIHTEAPAWSFVISFPSVQTGRGPDHSEGRIWVTRADIPFVEGAATLAYASSDYARLIDECPVAGAGCVDVVTDEDPQGLVLMIRRGGGNTFADVEIARVQCFVAAEEDVASALVPQIAILAPQVGWSRFFGTIVPDADISVRLRQMRYRRLDSPCPIPWLEGLQVVISPGEQISQAVYVSGLYEPCTASVLRRILGPGMTFVDVGANVGLFSMLASRWVGPTGRVFSFEPSRREYDRLRDHVDRNALTNVESFRAAACDVDGTVVLHVADARHSGLNTLQPTFMYDDVREASQERVPAVRIDSVLMTRPDLRVDVMKIDVEGAEAAVLAGASRILTRDKPALILEVTTPEAAAAFEGSLTSLGYAFLAIDGDAGRLASVTRLGGGSGIENYVAASPETVSMLLAGV
jgi:FkbM family methyltransferase